MLILFQINIQFSSDLPFLLKKKLKMEITKLYTCRLCAQSIRKDEIFGQLNDKDLDIESKLIICCQWNGIDEIQCDGMPQDVCASCYRSLYQSWNFAVQVKNAQMQIYSKLTAQNIASDADHMTDYDVYDGSMHDVKFEVETEMQTYSPSSMLQRIDDFIPKEYTDEFIVLDNIKEYEQAEINVAEHSTDKRFETESINHIENITVDEIDLKKPKATSKYTEINFINSIGKKDRNSDGSIKLEAVQRLGLDNWSIIEYKCYLCYMQLPDHYDWRSHVKMEHPGQPFRHLCNICNIKNYTQRKPLFKHVMSIHRRYFKYWYVIVMDLGIGSNSQIDK